MPQCTGFEPSFWWSQASTVEVEKLKSGKRYAPGLWVLLSLGISLGDGLHFLMHAYNKHVYQCICVCMYVCITEQLLVIHDFLHSLVLMN